MFSIEAGIARGDERYARMRAWAMGEEPLDSRIFDRRVGEHAKLLDILRSIECDQRQIFAANVPNRGAVPSLPPRVSTRGANWEGEALSMHIL